MVLPAALWGPVLTGTARLCSGVSSGKHLPSVLVPMPTSS